MVYNEKEMLEVCRKYGIDVVEKEGYPLYEGQEMDPDFSMYDIMHDTCLPVSDDVILYSKTMELEVSVRFEENGYINCLFNDPDKPSFLNVDKDDEYKKTESLISYDTIVIAA